MEIFYNNHYREVSDNKMSKEQLAEVTIYYLQTRHDKMSAEAEKLAKIEEERELTKVEEQKLARLVEECVKYEHIISFTEMELSLMESEKRQ